MKIITVRQPWADLLAMKIKKVEFRSWRTNHRGQVAIHAGLTVDTAAREHFWKIFSNPASIVREIPRVVVGDDLERIRGYLAHPRKGVIVAVGRIAGCEKSEYHYEELGFSEESWGWVFEDVVELKREVRIVGRQGLFTASPQDATRIRAAITGPVDTKVKLEHTMDIPRKKETPKGPPMYETVGSFRVRKD
jgi:hypothetical protein